MKFGAHTFLWTKHFDETHVGILGWLKDQGFDGVEIARYQLENFPTAVVRKELQRLDLRCTLCCGLTGELSLISPDQAVREKAISFITRAIQLATEIGAEKISGPLCSPIGYFTGHRRTQEEWQHAINGLRKIESVLAEHGLTMAIEPLNRYQTYFLNTALDVVALCKEAGTSRIGLLFDVFHANIEDRDLPGVILSAGPYLQHVHLCENDRGTPGTGHLPWADLFAALNRIGYDQWLVIESFNFQDEEISAMTRTWRDLAPTPESIASEGLKFLKRQGSRA